MQLDQELISKLIGAYDEDHPECNNRTIQENQYKHQSDVHQSDVHQSDVHQSDVHQYDNTAQSTASVETSINNVLVQINRLWIIMIWLNVYANK